MITKQQKEVARAMYAGQLSESEVGERFGVRPKVLQRWLSQAEFQEELEHLRKESIREVRNTIARYGPIAALRLAELIGSEKPDVARRAALDMIDRCLEKPAGKAEQIDEEGVEEELSEEQARKMVLTLAEGMKET